MGDRDMMRAGEIQEVVEETLMRNLRILVGAAAFQAPDQEGVGVTVVKAEDVEAMLKACAANLAQGFAGRVQR